MAAGCSVGTVRHTFSDRVRKGRVLSQKPKAGVERALRARVHLVVSKGRSPN
jgi:beta-lactam-binding protein with PASTA domain